jgi:hypothetical protein
VREGGREKGRNGGREWKRGREGETEKEEGGGGGCRERETERERDQSSLASRHSAIGGKKKRPESEKKKTRVSRLPALRHSNKYSLPRSSPPFSYDRPDGLGDRIQAEFVFSKHFF